MVKGLEELRQKRLKWIEANRENNFEEGIKRLLTDLYPDNAHFIYELLQNAEDPRASIVRFTLTGEAVEFEHNGDRLFDLRDVESITSIGASTKRDDPTSIGEFGVGFKAVFAYTNTPEIHSGEFHFRIHDLVVPETNGVRKSAIGDHETRFVFPFDHPTKRPVQAVDEIERALRALGDNTLLFLSHIRVIEYLLPDGSLGSLKRIDHDGGHLEIRARHPGGKDTVSHWLRFQKDVEVIDENGKTKTCRIAIAYEKRHAAWKIVPLDHGQVSIYFPAEKETSNLRLHLHAPFASTVARDSVRDCPQNHALRDHLAELIVDSLEIIRKRGLLTVNFLEVLPIDEDNLPDFYEPIREAIVEAFRERALTPTKSGGHEPASALYRGPSDIVTLLDDDDLVLLTGNNWEPPLWAANPPQVHQRADKFQMQLSIDEWGWRELGKAFTFHDLNTFPYQLSRPNEELRRSTLENWLAMKEDAWLQRLYALLEDMASRHRVAVWPGPLRLVRVEAEDGICHVSPEEAFFPPESDAEGGLPISGIRFVRAATYASGRAEEQKRAARAFLDRIGVRTYDEGTYIGQLLRRYEDAENMPSDKEHLAHLKRFIAYWKHHPDDTALFFKCEFLRGQSTEGDDGGGEEPVWCSPSELCLDVPFEDTGLSSVPHTRDWTVWPGYQGWKPPKDFVAFLKAVGVMHEFKVERALTEKNPKKGELWKDYRREGVRWTDSAIDEDYTIPHIDDYVSEPAVESSRLLWQALTKADARVAAARFRPNRQYPTREAESQLVLWLKNNAWIPDREGQFYLPQGMTQDQLPTDFPYDDRNGLLTAIGFGEGAKKRSEEYRAKNEAAKEMGFGSAEEAEEMGKIVRETGITREEFRSLVSQRQCASQPEESVPNPERRREGVLERRDNAPTRESVTRERTIQPGARPETLEAKAYLRAKYKNTEGQLICQCCHAEMPFKVNGDHYFEAIQCVRGLDHHYFENRLALCPTCAAMYQHARETNDAEIRRSIVEHNASDTVVSAEILIRLAGRVYQLRFVGTHWFDLKTVLTD